MSGNDYYYDGYSHQQTDPSRPPPAPYYDPQYGVSRQVTPTPSYHTNPPSTAHGYPGGTAAEQPANSKYGPSPFDTVFDDHVYPANSNTRPYAGGSGDVSQQSLYPDSAYYNQGRASPESRPYGAEDIPLQDRNKLGDMNDHVYDDPNGLQSKRRKPRKVRLGELGMIGTDRKRIPWVVYIFSLIQVAVLIAEIVRNGRNCPYMRLGDMR
jgi:hypothetical protein